MLRKREKGFTLVELLVVMAIIGILATVILGGFRSSQRRSRDAARKSDLKQIANALEMFYSDYERYPAGSSGNILACPYDTIQTDGDGSGVCTWGDEDKAMTDSKTDYMRTLPEDPSGGEYYYRTLYSNQAFQLYAHLENAEDQNCINPGCTTDDLPSDIDCDEDCNYAITSANVTPKDNDAE